MTSKANRRFTGFVFGAIALIMFLLSLLGYLPYVAVAVGLIVSFVVGYVTADIFYGRNEDE